MKRHLRYVRAILAALALLSFSQIISAQEITGAMTGTVKDANGAGIAGATVTISDADKQVVVRTVTTNEGGDFSAPNLLSGFYDISVEAPNFKKSVLSRIKLDVGQHRSIDLVLEAGNITESVLVTSAPVAVTLTTPTSSTVINGDQVRQLSINNRNFVQLVTLAPGVTNDLDDLVFTGTNNPDTQVVNRTLISVNGARSTQNTFTVDGADVTDRGSNLTIQAYPSVDSIGEFKVLRSLFPAESGRSGGGQINVVTRSGTNEFHGSGFEFFRNEIFNANNFLLNATTNPPFGRDDNGKAKRAPFHYHDFGWTIGGPVYFFRFGEGNPDGKDWVDKVDRTFFFFSQEFRRDRRFTSASIVTVPDANLRNGVFPIPVCINRPALGENNCTGSFILPAGTPIPSALLSPAAQAYVSGIYNKLPLPNAGTAAAPYNLAVSLGNIADFDQTIIKFDHAFSDNWNMYYRYENDKIPTLDANAL